MSSTDTVSLGTIGGAAWSNIGDAGALMRATLATANVITSSRFDDLFAFASALYPKLAHSECASNNYLLSMLYKWAIECPESAPSHPLMVAAVAHASPSAGAAHGRTAVFEKSDVHPVPVSSTVEASGAGALASEDLVTGLPPAQQRSLEPTHGLHHSDPSAVHESTPGASKTSWRVRCDELEMVIAGVADSEAHGVIYLSTNHTLLSALKGFESMNDANKAASIEIILQRASQRLANAILGAEETELIGGKSFATEPTLIDHGFSISAVAFDDALTKMNTKHTGLDDEGATMLLSDHAPRSSVPHSRRRSISEMFGLPTKHAETPSEVASVVVQASSVAGKAPAGLPEAESVAKSDHQATPEVVQMSNVDPGCSPTPSTSAPRSDARMPRSLRTEERLGTPLEETAVDDVSTAAGNVFKALGPLSLLVQPKAGAHAPFVVRRFIGPAAVVNSVAAAYVEAASHFARTHGNEGGSCHSKLFQCFDVYEFSRRDACGADADALHAAENASFEHARERASRARQLGIVFRHATVEDYKTIAHDFYRFYKESYNEEMPESLQSAKAQELRNAILDGEYFIMLAPASWLVDATGIATKLDRAESIARDKRARTGSELTPEAQRMVPVAMTSVRGRHPLGARIAEVYVKEDYRKKGFGVLLFNMLVDLVIGTEKLNSLCLFGAASAEALPNLMQKAGFTKKESLQMVDIVTDAGSRLCHPAHASKCVIQ